jgi:uncharacterized protein YdaU (DUF1376 family)
MYYDSENKIPLDTQWVARRLRLDTKTVETVLNDMFVRHEDGWFNARCQDVIQQYHAMAEKNRANGRLGGRKKNPTANPMGNDSQPIVKATINQELETINNKLKRDKTTSVVCPPDVEQQIWDDWKQLRKAKKAPVTETVVNSARKEAAKANMAFQDFLSVWCARGSQGLQADWLKPDERNLSKTGQMNQRVISGLTRGLIGGGGNVKLLGN